jgi:hypothetical protein
VPDGSLVEAVEWPGHPWSVGVQFHPEFISSPMAPSPLFKSFIAACRQYADEHAGERSAPGDAESSEQTELSQMITQ